MKIASALVVLTIVMVLLSLKEAHGFPGLEAIYGLAGVIGFAIVIKILSHFIQRDGLIDD